MAFCGVAAVTIVSKELQHNPTIIIPLVFILSFTSSLSSTSSALLPFPHQSIKCTSTHLRQKNHSTNPECFPDCPCHRSFHPSAEEAEGSQVDHERRRCALHSNCSYPSHSPPATDCNYIVICNGQISNLYSTT